MKKISSLASAVYAANFRAGGSLSNITNDQPTWLKAFLTLHGLAQFRFAEVRCRHCGHVDKPSKSLAAYRFSKDVLRMARREGWL